MAGELMTLFAGAFVAATLLPGGSEVLLYYLAREGEIPGWALLAVAAAGNSLGGMTSWALGRCLPPARARRPALVRAVERVRRHGSPVLLLAWVPLVGDPLCVAAGWLRVGWLASLVFITAGKTARYAVVLAAA